MTGEAGRLPALPGADGAWLPAGLADRVLLPLAEALPSEALADLLGAPLAQVLRTRRGLDPAPLAAPALAAAVAARGIRSRAEALIAGLRDHDVACVPIKGFATGATLYPHPAYRAMPDVDLLVEAGDVARTALWLRAQGFRPAGGHLALRRWGALTRASFAPLASPDGALLLDLHQAIDDPPASLGLPAADVIAGASPLPCPSHAYIIAALHAFRDFYEPRSIKGLIDSALLLERHGAAIDWAEVQARAMRGRFIGRLRLHAEVLAACGVPAPPLFAAAGRQSRFARAAASNFATPAWHRLADHRKVAVEFMALDHVVDLARLYARRLRGLVRPASHTLPGF